MNLERGDRRVAEAAGTTDHGCDPAGLRDASPERCQVVAVREPDPGDPDAHEGAPVVRTSEDGVETGGGDGDLRNDRRRQRFGPTDGRSLVDLDVAGSL